MKSALSSKEITTFPNRCSVCCGQWKDLPFASRRVR
jgi:hypothetical protein